MAPISWPSWRQRAEEEDTQEAQNEVSSATGSAVESIPETSSLVEPESSAASATVLEAIATSAPEAESTVVATIDATTPVAQSIPVPTPAPAPVDTNPVPPDNQPLPNAPPSDSVVSSAKPSAPVASSAQPPAPVASSAQPSAPVASAVEPSATAVAAEPSSSSVVVSNSSSKITSEIAAPSSVTPSLVSSVSASRTDLLSTILLSSTASVSSASSSTESANPRVALNLLDETTSSEELVSATVTATSFSESVISSGGVAIATSTIPVATLTRVTTLPRSSTTVVADPLSSKNKNETSNSKMIMIGSIAGVVFLLASCLLVAFFLKRTRRRRAERDMEILDFTPTAGAEILSASDIEKLPRSGSVMTEKNSAPSSAPSRGPSTKPRPPTLGPRPAPRMAQLDLPNLTTAELPSVIMQRGKAPSPVEVKRLSPPVSQDPFWAPTTSNGASPTSGSAGRSTPSPAPPVPLNPFSDPDPFADPAVFPPSRLSTMSGTSQGTVSSSSKYGFAV